MLLNEKKDDVEIFSEIVSIEFEALGTEIELRLVVDEKSQIDQAGKDLEKAREMYGYFTKIFSRFDQESELSILNNELGNFNVASDYILEAVNDCLKFNKNTSGIFDPRIIETLEAVGYKNDFKKGDFILADNGGKSDKTIPLSDDLKIKGRKIFFGVRIDLSGMAKGFITDKISNFLLEKGWKNFLIDSGGDMFLSGLDQDEDVWRIDVDGIPYEKMMLALSNKGLATSGISKRKWEIDGQKFHHLINPKEPENFSFDLKTVTVISDTTENADVWAKCLFLMGKESAIMYARENNMAAIILDYRGSAWISPSAKEYLYK
jgi:thiamine biosynthesis lipoprotein